ncbi:MAG TPA: DUF3024 domain-containing protein [Gallionella sp.]|nr:DUF3024 domain-containing protein [Gallionella sp.]
MSNGQATRKYRRMAVNYPMPHAAEPHPNEFDLRRIECLLEQRARYRYVSPAVQPIDGGYLVVSPCCSRNIDANGGAIDIARIEYILSEGIWRLYQKDHQQDAWKPHSDAATLHDVIACLNEDPSRVFWQ